MEMLPEDWQSILDEDPYLARAQAIAQGEGRLEFSTLASIWLGILSEVGLRGSIHLPVRHLRRKLLTIPNLSRSTPTLFR
jgi:hypothetical protein